MKKKDKRLKENKNILTDKQINDIGEKIGKENFLEGEGGDLGRTIRVPINSDSCRVYTLRSSLGYIYAFQHPAVFIEGEHVPQHCRHLSGALKISNLGSALNLKAKFEVNLRIKYEVEELEMELRSFSLSSTSLSLAK